MQAKFEVLRKNQTWVLVLISYATHVVDHIWVFKKKLNANGSLHRLKARLVTKGFQYTPRVNFLETFSLMVKTTTIKVILSLVVSYGWKIHQIDVNNAFLNGDLQKDIFIT